MCVCICKWRGWILGVGGGGALSILYIEISDAEKDQIWSC